MMLHERLIVVRGAGDLASAVAWRFFKSGFPLVMTEVDRPLAVRRKVSFCEAVWDGSSVVEGVVARLIEGPGEVGRIQAKGEIPLMVDPDLERLPELEASVLVDATLAKKNLGIHKDLAPLVIGVGPGFSAGDDVHLVVETKRGHNLGRVITEGKAIANTGTPGNIGGYSSERVLRAPADGLFEIKLDLGAIVKAGDIIAEVAGEPLRTKIAGLIRGLIRPGSQVRKGLKVGDVDPRGDVSYLDTISDKARAVAGGVLEAVLRVYNR
jgi:xanthine dehydrogenase accessory factor